MRSISHTPPSFVRSVTEIRALQRYMIEALELQQHEQDLKDRPAACAIVGELLELLPDHIARLDQHIALLPGSRDALRTSAAAMSGAFLQFLNKTRSRDTSSILRDDYALLNVADMDYLTLHAAANALGCVNIAEVAVQNRAELLPVIQKIAQLLPKLVTQDLPHNEEVLDEASGKATLGDHSTAIIDVLAVPALI